MAGSSETVTLPRGGGAEGGGERPQLVVALTSDRPLEPSSRHLLRVL